MAKDAKPRPRRDGYHDGFYAYCDKHELRFQRCADCQTWRHMPRDCCPECGSFEWTWERSSGKGTLFSWTVIHRALHPSFEADLPYAPVVVEMDEGIRLVSLLRGVAIEDLALGLALEVGFDEDRDGVTLHHFRRPGSA